MEIVRAYRTCDFADFNKSSRFLCFYKNGTYKETKSVPDNFFGIDKIYRLDSNGYLIEVSQTGYALSETLVTGDIINIRTKTQTYLNFVYLDSKDDVIRVIGIKDLLRGMSFFSLEYCFKIEFYGNEYIGEIIALKDIVAIDVVNKI